jgi:hypothetical protein
MAYKFKNNTYFATPKDDWKDRIQLSKGICVPTFLGVQTFVFRPSHYFKVLWSVVFLVLVDMMDYLGIEQRPVCETLHNKNAIQNISRPHRPVMSRFPNPQISRRTSITPFIIGTGLSFLKLGLGGKVFPLEGLPIAPTRTIPFDAPRRISNLEFFSTGDTFFSNHNYSIAK